MAVAAAVTLASTPTISSKLNKVHVNQGFAHLLAILYLLRVQWPVRQRTLPVQRSRSATMYSQLVVGSGSVDAPGNRKRSRAAAETLWSSFSRPRSSLEFVGSAVVAPGATSQSPRQHFAGPCWPFALPRRRSLLLGPLELPRLRQPSRAVAGQAGGHP